MINLFFFGEMISIQIAAWFLMFEDWFKIKLLFHFFDNSVNWANTHSSNFNVVVRLAIPLPYLGLIHVNRIVDLSAELRVLVQVGNMRFTQINLIVCKCFLLNLLPFYFGDFVVVFFLWNEFQLGLSLQLLFQFFRRQHELFVKLFHLL